MTRVILSLSKKACLLTLNSNHDSDSSTHYLKANDAILYEKEDIYDDLKENYGSTIEHIAGGATQNSVRVAQWILGKWWGFLV